MRPGMRGTGFFSRRILKTEPRRGPEAFWIPRGLGAAFRFSPRKLVQYGSPPDWLRRKQSEGLVGPMPTPRLRIENQSLKKSVYRVT